MVLSEGRRRRRRWPFVVGGLLVLLAGGALAMYLTLGQTPGDVSNPDAEFTETQPPAPKPKRRDFRWPFYGYTPQRTRYIDADIKPPLRAVWKWGRGQLLEFQPVLADNKLFLVRNGGEVVALNARNGKVRWRRDSGAKAASSPAWSQHRLFVTILEPGRILALRARTGKRIWRKSLPSRTESSPLIRGGRVYFGSEDGTVYCLRARDGKEIWRYQAAGAVKAGLAYSKGLLFFGDYGGEFTAIRARDGKEVWSLDSEGRSFGRSGNFYSTPAVAFGRVYVGNTDGFVYSFVARNGKLAWRTQTGAFVYAAPAVARVPGFKPAVYIGSYDGNFYALDARSGSKLWTHNAGGKISGAATVVGDVVYFGNLGKKNTRALNARTGKKVWGFHAGAFNPVISDGKRIYLTGYSSEYAFEPVERKRPERRRRSRRRGGSR
jgi:outer membrane protein assembly factor BamB